MELTWGSLFSGDALGSVALTLVLKELHFLPLRTCFLFTTGPPNFRPGRFPELSAFFWSTTNSELIGLGGNCVNGLGFGPFLTCKPGCLRGFLLDVSPISSEREEVGGFHAPFGSKSTCPLRFCPAFIPGGCSPHAEALCRLLLTAR